MSALRPATVDHLRGRAHLVHVATVGATLRSSPDRVYRVLKGVAEGKGGRMERAEVVDRSGNRLLCDFWTFIRLPNGGEYRFRTRETVELDPPATIHYRHRSGPSRGLAETIRILELDDQRVRVIYRAVYPTPRRWWGWLFALVAKPVAHLFMWLHFRELRETAERDRGRRSGERAGRVVSVPPALSSS